MTATGHALIAALIAAKFHNPALAIPLAFTSHIVLDLVPHWDSGTHHRSKTRHRLFAEAALDVIISFFAAGFLYGPILGQTNYVYLYICVFFAQLPDWVMAPSLIFNSKFSLFTAARSFGSKTNTKLDKPWGIITQIAAVIIVYVLLFKFPSF